MPRLSIFEALRDVLVKHIDDAQFRQQVNALCRDLSSHVGSSWKQALA